MLIERLRNATRDDWIVSAIGGALIIAMVMA